MHIFPEYGKNVEVQAVTGLPKLKAAAINFTMPLIHEATRIEVL